MPSARAGATRRDAVTHRRRAATTVAAAAAAAEADRRTDISRWRFRAQVPQPLLSPSAHSLPQQTRPSASASVDLSHRQQRRTTPAPQRRRRRPGKHFRFRYRSSAEKDREFTVTRRRRGKTSFTLWAIASLPRRTGRFSDIRRLHPRTRW